MSFGLSLDVEESLDADLQMTFEELAEAAMAAADSVEAWGKELWRGQIRRAGLGNRLANTVRSRVYPRRGASLTPAVTWWSNAPHIVHAFSEGITIRSGEGFWLPIPTEHAPKAARIIGLNGRVRRGRRNLIAEAEKRFGRLRFIAVPGRNLGLLVADKVRARKGQRGGYARASDAALRRGDFEDGVVMFVLVPEVRMPKKLNLDAVVDAIGREGVDRFARALAEVTRRRFPQAA